MLTEKEYVENGGVICPVCGNNGVEAPNRPQNDTVSEIYQEVQCSKCSATWVDVYTLSGYDNLEE